MFHTGLHPDYHRPSDDAHLVNIEGIESVLEVVFQTFLQVANNETTVFHFVRQHFMSQIRLGKNLKKKHSCQ